jgi:signal transduction histidine kinase
MKLIAKIRQYHFELRHMLVLFCVLMLFQIVLSLQHRLSLRNFIIRSQEWYQQDAAEKNAHLTATAIELLLETSMRGRPLDEPSARQMIQAFNIILNQQILQEHVDEVCILVDQGPKVFRIDDGRVFYDYIAHQTEPLVAAALPQSEAIELYRKNRERVHTEEQIVTIIEGRQTFHVLVPLVPRGEKMGVVYMKITPEFSLISETVISDYTKVGVLFLGLMLLGLLAMFYISSYSLRQRDLAQQELFQQRVQQIADRVHFQKEALFTKRIYHTHHKAEKVMGFIKEDLHLLSRDNMAETKYRVTRYANFVSRVIYDMKWFDPPLQTIRNPLFHTDLNEVIRFIISHIFLRTTHEHPLLRFETRLAPELPCVPVNEFVIWEILEPLLQNSVEHGGETLLTVIVATEWIAEQNNIRVTIADNGQGIPPVLLAMDQEGVQRIFQESTSTKSETQNAGYGCYIAYEMAQRCKWRLVAENQPEQGCRFIITVPVAAETGPDVAV